MTLLETEPVTDIPNVTSFDMGPFADFEALAFHEFGRLEAEYAKAGEGHNTRWTEEQRGHIARKQRQLLAMLGELAAELPCVELLQVSTAAEAELAEVEARLTTIDDEPDVRKLAVSAWAARLVNEWHGVTDETADKVKADRIEEINAAKRSPIEQRRDELRGWLATVWDSAGQAWPLPTMYTGGIETGNNGSSHHGGSSTGRVSGKVVTINFGELKRQHKGGKTSSNTSGERYFDPSDVSNLIVAHVRQRIDQTIIVESLVQAAYPERIAAGEDPRKLRSLITSAMGPKSKGPHIQELLQSAHLVLWYGWRRLYTQSPDAKLKYDTTHRVYRVISILRQAEVLKPFIEVEVDGEVIEHPAVEAANEDHALALVG